MLELVIGTDETTGLKINMYLDNYSVNIAEKYANNSSFTSISGDTINKYLGDVRKLSVDFEPMETKQINELISKIKSYSNDIPIIYVDPQYGKIQRRFSCNDLPTATYFESDDKKQFWKIPTVVFTETDDSAKEHWGGYG